MIIYLRQAHNLFTLEDDEQENNERRRQAQQELIKLIDEVLQSDEGSRLKVIMSVQEERINDGHRQINDSADLPYVFAERVTNFIEIKED